MNSFLETLKQLGPARMAAMGGVMLALLFFFIFVSMRVSTPDMRLLYSDLSSFDSSAIAARLEETQILYEVSQDGSKIMVPGQDISRARILLAEAGLPNGGSMGYELFDQQSGFGTTTTVQNINQVRALEGELARTISALDPIRSARVHLVLPQRELFSRENREASASVALGLRPGARLSQNQILAIQSLVSSAVPQLTNEHVSIIDQDGNLLARGGDENATVASLKAEEMKLNYERRMTGVIEDLLSRTVGFGKVRANVTAELNFDRVSTNEELYSPEGQVARSTQTVEESASEKENGAGNVSVENNLPAVGADLLLQDGPTSESNRIEEVTNYEISKTIRSVVREAGEVERLSVAVLVDGTYTEADDGTRTYQPRSDEELDQIAALVRSAIGFDAARGDTLEVINMRFAAVEVSDDALKEELLFGFEKSQILDTAEVLTLSVVVILVVLLVLQPMLGRLLASGSTAEKLEEEDDSMDLLTGRPASPALEAPQDFKPPEVEEDSMIDMQSVEGKVKASAVKKVEDIVDAYPNEAVSVLRNWMTQES